MPKAYSIVASNHIDGAAEFIKTLAPGQPVVLVREPSNEHDRNAVAVWIAGRKVGYIPMKQNVVLAQFIDHAGNIDAPARAAAMGMATDQNPETVRAITA